MCAVLNPGHFEKQIRYTAETLKCGVAGGLRRSAGPIVCEMKYCIYLRRRETSDIRGVSEK